MKPVFFGCAGPVLSQTERAFFNKEKPAGFILFTRNVESREQLATLTSDLKKSVGRHKVPILIDQEGGRVQRMTAPVWRKYPAMKVFGDMALENPTLAASALRLNCRLIADDLRRVGINVNCLPLLDVLHDGTDNSIGDRAFSNEPGLVAALGRITVDALKEGGVLPIIKHMPGQGRAEQDSHHDLPEINIQQGSFEKIDLAPFQTLKDAPFGMISHCVYTQTDPENPATLSRLVIARLIRMKIGFRGLLITDDISMGALAGDVEDNAVAALNAGCDLVLHCNGNMDEMQKIASRIKVNENGLEKRIANLVRQVERAPMIDRGDLVRRYKELMTKF